MTGAHIVEGLCFEIDFASEAEAFEAQERLTRFAQGRAQQVIGEVFDEVVEPDTVLRLERLEVDVGTVAAVDFEERFAKRLREVLRALLEERRAGLESSVGLGASVSSVDALTTSPRAELDWLLHFIEHGFLPWHAPVPMGRDVQALAARVLENMGAELARALRAVPVSQWRMIFRRLVAQFPAQWLARLGRQIGLARRGASVGGAQWLVGTGGAPGDGVQDSAAEFVTGAATFATDTQTPTRTRRAQIEALLGDSLESGAALIASAAMPVAVDTWRSVLRDDAEWLKETLLRHGGALRVRRRLAEVLPEGVVADLLRLWLGPAHVDIVLATIGVRTASFTDERANTDTPDGAISAGGLLAALTYLLVEGGAWKFSESDYRRSMAGQIGHHGEEALVREGAAARPTSGSRAGATPDRKPTSGTMLRGADSVSAAGVTSVAVTLRTVDVVSAVDVENSSAVVNAVDPRSPLYDATRLQPNQEPAEISAVRPGTSGSSAMPAVGQTILSDELHEARDDPHEDLARSRARAQIEAILGELPESDFVPDAPGPVATDTWRRVLRDDAPWLKETLLRLGRGVRIRRRLAAVLPEAVVAEVLGLWLGPAQVDVVLTTIAVSPSPFTHPPASTDAPREALRTARLLAALTYILVDGAALEFSESDYWRNLADYIARGGNEALELAGVAARPAPGPPPGAEHDKKATTLTGLRGADDSPVEVSATRSHALADSGTTQPPHTVAPDELSEALGGAREAPTRSRARAQIQAILGESPESDFGRVALGSVAADTWRRVLRDDAQWLKETLLRRGIRACQRLAAVLPGEVVGDVLALWLSPDQVDVVLATITVGTVSFTSERRNAAGPCAAINAAGLLATLTYILTEGGARKFSESGYRGSLANKTVRDGDDVLPHHEISSGSIPGLQSSVELPDKMRDSSPSTTAPNTPRGQARASSLENLRPVNPSELLSEGKPVICATAYFEPDSNTTEATELSPSTQAGSERPAATHIPGSGQAIEAGQNFRASTPPLENGATPLTAERGSPVARISPTKGLQQPLPDIAQAQNSHSALPPAAVQSRDESERDKASVRSIDARAEQAGHPALSTDIQGISSPADAQSHVMTADAPPPSGLELEPAGVPGTEASPTAAPSDPSPATLTRLADSTEGSTSAVSDAGLMPCDVDLLRHLRGAPTPDSPTEALRRTWRALLHQRSAAARHALGAALEYPGAGRRLAGLLATGDLADVLQWLRPALPAKRVPRTRSGTASPRGATGPAGTQTREGVHPNPFERTSAQTAAGSPLLQPASATQDTAVNQRIYIANAGVVIVGPYLPRLFSMLGLTDKESFKSLICAHRAVHLIQYIVTGAISSPEPLLVLNKILCGLPISAPIPLDIDFRAQEQTAIEEMLAAIIAHWKAIGRTSIAGLRESFLQREGRLVSSEDAWRLRVESKCFDMLLDRLPWGYAMVKYPWMKRVLHVDWR